MVCLIITAISYSYYCRIMKLLRPTATESCSVQHLAVACLVQCVPPGSQPKLLHIPGAVVPFSSVPDPYASHHGR
jgi:hypothetical protein